MKPEPPIPLLPDPESRITALLLGELSPAEAAEVRKLIADYPTLAQLHERLRKTIELVQEAEANPASNAAPSSAPMRLAEPRRERLLAQLKTVMAPTPPQAPTRRPLLVFPRVLQWAAVLAVLGLLAAVSIPNFVRARSAAQSNAILNNLRQLDGAKQQWALELGKSGEDVPTMEDLRPYLGRGDGKGLPLVAGETYAIGKVSESPVAELSSASGKVRGLNRGESKRITLDDSDAYAGVHPSGGAAESLTRLTRTNISVAANAPSRGESRREASSRRYGLARQAGESRPASARDPNLISKDLTLEGSQRTAEPEVALVPQSTEEELLRGRYGIRTPTKPQTRSAPAAAAGRGVASRPARTGGALALNGRELAESENRARGERVQSTQIVLPTPASDLGNVSASVAWGDSDNNGLLDLHNITVGNADVLTSYFSRDNSGLAAGTGAGAGGMSGAGGMGGGGGYGGFGGGRPAGPGGGITDTARFGYGNTVLNDFAIAAGEQAAPAGAMPSEPSRGVAHYNWALQTPAESAGKDLLAAVPETPSVPASPVTQSVPMAPVMAVEAPVAAPVVGVATLPVPADESSSEDLLPRPPKPASLPAVTRSSTAAATPPPPPPTAQPPPEIEMPALAMAPLEPTRQLSVQEPATGLATAVDKLEPLDIKLPTPAFMGTPVDLPLTSSSKTEALGFEDAQQGIVTTSPAPVTDRTGPAVLGDAPMLGTLFRSQTEGREVRGGDLDLMLEAKPADKESAGVPVERFDTALTEGLGEVRERVAGLKRVDSGAIPKGVPADGEEAVLGRVVGKPALREAESKSRQVESLKQEVAHLEKVRDAILSRALQETVDASLPKTSMVEVTDEATAQPAQKQSLWGRVKNTLTGEVERSARLSIDKDVADVNALGFKADGTSFDPYFAQAEAEAIKSKAVLEKAAEKLNLGAVQAGQAAADGKSSSAATVEFLRKRIEVQPVPNSSLVEVHAKSDSGEEAARIANAVAEAYRERRREQRAEVAKQGSRALEEQLAKAERKLSEAQAQLDEAKKKAAIEKEPDRPAATPVPSAPPPEPQPETATAENPFSTFSLNVSDVSWKLAATSLQNGTMPDPASIRSEEFVNAFDYRDPAPVAAPIGFNWERAQYPFAHNRDIIRFAVQTAAAGREGGRPLNLVLLLDNSGSMERADRVSIIREALRVLAAQLQPQDRISVVTFARTPRLWVDALPGNQALEALDQIGGLTPEGGTNLGDAMDLAYATAARHYLTNGVNRVVLLTDGAANLGDLNPDSLKQKVETHRRQGIALDGFGVGWEGYNDDLLEVLTRHGDGRYGFINTPEEAAEGFANQLAGALRVAAADVKVQVEFNPRRTTAYRQIGYAKHRLTKEQFRDNTVDAAEIGAAESGNALYVIQTNPEGEGPIGIVRVRYREPETGLYREHEFEVPYLGPALPLDMSAASLRLATAASAFSEWLASSPYAAEVETDRLLALLGGVPEYYQLDPRPKQLEWMVRQAKSISGK